MTLAALEATLRTYLDPVLALREIPALRMLAETATAVEARAIQAHGELDRDVSARVAVIETASVVGGGSAPGQEIPSAGWAVHGNAVVLDRAFRRLATALVGRVTGDVFTIDFRTILPGEEEQVARAVEAVLRGEVDSK